MSGGSTPVRLRSRDDRSVVTDSWVPRIPRCDDDRDPAPSSARTLHPDTTKSGSVPFVSSDAMTSPPPLAIALVLLASAFLPAAPAAHAASIRGAIIDQASGAPLPFVEVVARRAADSTAVVAHTTTGSDGRFRLEGLAPDRYLLRAALLGHKPWVRRDLVLNDQAPDLDLGTIRLEVAPIAIPGAEVRTSRETAIVAADRNIY